MLRRSVALAFFAFAFVLACVHAKPGGNPELVKPALDTFLQRVRWADWRGASELIVSERREAFLAARQREHEGKDLQIADYQLEDFSLKNGNYRVVAVSQLAWVKLPSSSVAQKSVQLELIWRDGAWWISRITDGPFDELSELFDWKPPDSGS